MKSRKKSRATFISAKTAEQWFTSETENKRFLVFPQHFCLVNILKRKHHLDNGKVEENI